jgi:hypothetical protein
MEFKRVNKKIKKTFHVFFTGKNNRKFSHLNFQKTGITSWPPGVDGGRSCVARHCILEPPYGCNEQFFKILTYKKFAPVMASKFRSNS